MTSTPRVFIQIKSQYSNFNETEKKIADFFLENPQELIYSTISQVADKLKLADSTIFRFCKKINFKGFHDLKISLATDLSGNINNCSNNQIHDSDDEPTIINKVFNSNISVLKDTLASIDSTSIEKAVNLLLGAEQIVFYGNGGSGIVAMDAHHKFLRIGLKATSYTDYHMQLMSVAQLTEKDVIVVISHSGSNLCIMNVLDIAKENGTKSIGITSFSKSPINEKVDIPLNIISHETEYRFEAFASRIAHLSIIDVLYISTTLKRKELSDNALKKMRDAISYTKI
ncbi:MurR/RpiR family transcriptional regulator [Tepidimicrobium xylanilyticum]|uniref:Transcriptional regulator, RpiR family n=1 Tax=Tepidimicrobium xylanilyticum TaxID=1123352 RepID=A0A1H2XN98_9FIRM|nr:MurR/RpiR family transcriptional regulator [Tepidimicrobium xylanilyticum]GMG97542.1 RpiR family transcriptional regulator [Tepidimicrobium xylanilyticum]SDW93954.1 transcriptional regulator, RpiR family [Tepidimicrobium xylanilyticum]